MYLNLFCTCIYIFTCCLYIHKFIYSYVVICICTFIIIQRHVMESLSVFHSALQGLEFAKEVKERTPTSRVLLSQLREATEAFHLLQININNFI